MREPVLRNYKYIKIKICLFLNIGGFDGQVWNRISFPSNKPLGFFFSLIAFFPKPSLVIVKRQFIFLLSPREFALPSPSSALFESERACLVNDRPGHMLTRGRRKRVFISIAIGKYLRPIAAAFHPFYAMMMMRMMRGLRSLVDRGGQNKHSEMKAPTSHKTST